MSSIPDPALGYVPALIAALGLLTIAISLPLIARKVRRNLVYGIRTPLAFSSEENWYRVNHIGGKLFLRAGIATLVVGAIGFLIPPPWLIAYALVALFLAVAFAMTAVLGCLRIR